MQTLVNIILSSVLIVILTALGFACTTYGWPFISGLITGFAIFEFGHWGETGKLYWFKFSD